ncbi:T6SS immunity protein Tli4 family protein [Pseudomonas sp. PS01303]|uniref:T6SS immunity protein Tli4 family protein n=1 Tax=Pseudomonas sp. PS01303 TaxID=2991439 RepID=UPI00249AC836|nr:T6SS immunity protein Tli4 family protein [Pseudomonas sp. PS01303]
MHSIKSIYALISCCFLLAQGAQAETNTITQQSRTECLGRSVFDIKSEIKWHLLNDQWTYTNGTNFTTYSPDISLADKQLSYGSDPTNDAYGLVTIEVSPKTNLETFNELVGSHRPDITVAKERVVKNQIDKISEIMTGDLSRSDPAKYKSLQKQRLDLRKTLTRVRKVSTELVVLPDFIIQFKRENRPYKHFEVELEAYKKEFDTYPTDELYAEQSAFDFGMPDAYGARYPDKLIVLLWRDDRIYRFAFGQQSDYSEHRSSFEKLLPAARDLLARFRTRAEFEIPKETGFCLPFGFIADDGKAHYSITMAWHTTDNPNLLYSLSLSDDIGKALNLLPVLTTPIMGNPFPSAGVIRTFGPSKVQIGSRTGIMGGKYYKPADPQNNETEATERFVMTAGLANKGYEPSMVLKAENYASTQVRSFEQSKEDFLNILKSFRLQPGMDRLTGK